MCHGGEHDRFGAPSLANTCRRWAFTACGKMCSLLAAAPFVSPSATSWHGDDDGDHIGQFPSEDGSRAKVSAEPGTPGSDHADREKPYVGSDRIA
jgi:hypothetical protein